MGAHVQSSTELIERILAEVRASASDSFSEQSTELLRKRLSRLLEESGYSTLTPERRPLTVVVIELRGFEAVVEQHDPTAVVNLLNRYLAQMNDIIAQHGGIIDNLSGGSLTILFGALAPHSEHAPRALACAVEMQQVMSRCNEQNEALHLPPLYLGIGIYSGELVTGAVGTSMHREYTVLGGTIRVATRIAKQCLRGQILLGDSTYRMVNDFILVGELNTLRVRGRRLPVTIYELLGITRPRALTVPQLEIRKSPRIPIQMPCYFQCVKGSGRRLKSTEALGAMHCGQVIDLGYHGLSMISPVRLEAGSEIMMSLSLQLLGNRTSDIYARIVVADTDQQGYRCSLEFTDIDLVGRQTIKQFVDSHVGTV
jgi:adenylate cyclase